MQKSRKNVNQRKIAFGRGEVIFNNTTPLACSTKGKTLTLTLTSAPMLYETGTWPLSIRSGRVYTEATVAIE